jgi:hypothetical protein
MNVRLMFALVAVALVAVAGHARLAARVSVDSDYLRTAIGLSADDIKAVQSGTPLTKTLSGRAGQEIVTFGVVRIKRPADDVFRMLQSIGISPLGITDRRTPVSQPTRPEDWSHLTMAPDALSHLTECRPGRCDVQMPAWAITRFADEATNTVARRVAFEVVSAYQQSGHRSLQPYADRDPGTPPSAEYERLLSTSEYLPVPMEAVRHYLDRYPTAATVGVTDDFYWSVHNFGMKPTVRVFHRVVADAAAVADPSDRVVGAVATLQVLATHYFSSSLEWHIVVRDATTPSAAFVYHLTRSWTPGLSGLRGALARSSAKRNGRQAVADYLEHTRRTIEARATQERSPRLAIRP